MKPPRFGYADPRTVDEALKLAAHHGDEAKFIAGGQSLMPMLNMRLARPSFLIDLNKVDGLASIDEDGDTLSVGSMTTQFAVETSELVARHCPLMSQAIPHIGHRGIRYRGTVGGSIVHADPAAELPAVALALDAVLDIVGPSGVRQVPASGFFVTWFTTSIEPNEIVSRIRFAKQSPSSGSAFLEVSRRHGDFALVGVAAMTEVSGDGFFLNPRLVAFGAGGVPVRLTDAEAAFAGNASSPAVLENAASAAREEVETAGDIHASADYRRWVVGVLAKRAITAAAKAAKSGGNGS